MLHRCTVLKVLQPSRVVSVVVTAAALVALLNQDTLRSGDEVAFLVGPLASVLNRRRVASRQVIARRDAEAEDLARHTRADASGPGLASFDARDNSGGALAG